MPTPTVEDLITRVNRLEIQLQAQQRLIASLLVGVNDGKTALEITAELRGRLYPFFLAGTEENEKFVTFLKAST